MLSSSERWRRIKEEEALQQEGEGKRKDGEENHPYTLYLALYSSHSKDYARKVASLVILALSDAMVNFFLIKLCLVLYAMSKVKSPSLKLEREKGEKQIVSSFLTLQVGEKRVSFGSNFVAYALK